ncbi:MAG: hypothetical protein ACJ8GN_04885 [Longimicrobiaceae bacterium]
MRRICWFALVAAAGAAAACMPTPPAPVPVSAPPGTTGLVGEWAGEYESPAVGRGGSIVFHLDAGRDTAQGDVLMVPRGSRAAPQRAPAEPGTVVRASLAPQVLTIRFVRVEGDRVTGVLDPYVDPECGCRVFTAFEGTLAGDRLRGTFVTRGEPSGPVTGTWRVERRAP